MYILGISAFYHDSAACLIRDGEIIAAAQEERFTRKKHDFRFPKNAVAYCLKEAKIPIDAVEYVAFYDKPFLTFERLLSTYVAFAPKGLGSFLKAMPVWLKQKLGTKEVIAKELGIDSSRIVFTLHHESHAASAFYPSPFQSAAILTMDGVGEWQSTSLGVGRGNEIKLLKEINFPHSLGLLYSAFTHYCGFKVNSGEYKLMGLAPYGEPKYVDLIKREIIDIKDDGSFKLNMKYFDYCVGLKMTNARFDKLFGGPARAAESDLVQRHMDIARSIQDVTEEVVLKMAKTARAETGEKNLCMAGGVALNCVANGALLREGTFENIWIQPAAGDAGGALGAAMSTWYSFLKNPRRADGKTDFQRGSYLGPMFTDDEIEADLKRRGRPYERLSREELVEKVAELIETEKVIGLHQGRMEFGPRALGNRSIIGDARSKNMQKVMNLKIKYRESFRPFAPSVASDRVSDFFEFPSDKESPYMLLVADVAKDKIVKMTSEQEKLFGIDKLNISRSTIPAITHVDYSARLQTVSRRDNPFYYDVIKEFDRRTGCPVIVNTSFNVRGEPIVCSPEDAYRCFMRTEMDYLVLGSCLLDKKAQPKLENDSNWRKEFALD